MWRIGVQFGEKSIADIVFSVQPENTELKTEDFSIKISSWKL